VRSKQLSSKFFEFNAYILALLGIHGGIFVLFLYTKWFYSKQLTEHFMRSIRVVDSYRYNIEFLSEFDVFQVIVDSLNIPLILLNLVLTTLTVFYVSDSMGNLHNVRKSVINLVFAMFLMNILFTTLNLGVFYVSFELLVIPCSF